MKLSTLLLISSAAAVALAVPAFAHHDGGPHGKRGIERMTALDTDNDGTISKAEAEAPAIERFEMADADGNGTLTAEEIQAFQQAERERRRAERFAARFERQDEDGDGVLSLEEFSAPGDARFDAIDADGDGFLTEEERETFHEENRGKRHGRRGPRN
ncbi:MAG: EF-hand domain-containing protein [Pseudomonadota bacterium]